MAFGDMFLVLTVLFSAVGPLIFGVAKTRLDAYAPLFPVFAVLSVALAGFAWFVRVNPPAGVDQ
jgi:hypothetical protein